MRICFARMFSLSLFNMQLEMDMTCIGSLTELDSQRSWPVSVTVATKAVYLILLTKRALLYK